MGAKCFGEFMGTAVLILLGDGVVANVLLKSSKAEGAGWMAIATGWAFAVVMRRITRHRVRQPGRALNPAVTFGLAVITGDFAKFLPFLLAQMLGAIAGRDSGLAALSASLARDGRSRREARVLLDHAGDPEFRGEPAQRNHRHVRARAGVAAIFSKKVAMADRPPALGRIWSASWCGRSACRWGNHRVRDQSGARPGSAHRPRVLPLGKKEARAGTTPRAGVGPLIGGGLAGCSSGWLISKRKNDYDHAPRSAAKCR